MHPATANWGISGDTVVAGTFSDHYEVVPDQLRIFRRGGTTWIPSSAIDGGFGEGDVRGNEIFFLSGPPAGTLVYRNDDSQTVVDNIRNVSASHGYGGYSQGFEHTNDLFVQDSDLFRKNAAGNYEHVAILRPTDDSYALIEDAAINGRRLISQAWRGNNSHPAALIFDLPATYTPSPVIATGFGSGASPFAPQLGTFAVATTANGNHVYRQSSLAGDYRALLGNSDWIEQSIEADIKPTAFSGSDRWAGLAVRYLDAPNYYYVTLRSSGRRRAQAHAQRRSVDDGSEGVAHRRGPQLSHRAGGLLQRDRDESRRPAISSPDRSRTSPGRRRIARLSHGG